MNYLHALETLDKDEAAMREATEVIQRASECFNLLEREIDLVDARNADLVRALERIRAKVDDYTYTESDDQNPSRGLLYELDRIAAEALS